MSMLILPTNLGYVFFMFRELNQLHFGVAFLVLLVIEAEGFECE